MNQPSRDRVTTTGRRAVAAAAVLISTTIVAVTACSAGATGSTGSSTATAASTTGPLDEFFAGPSVSPEEQQAKERQVQDLIVTCMAAEGFEYRPFVPR